MNTEDHLEDLVIAGRKRNIEVIGQVHGDSLRDGHI